MQKAHIHISRIKKSKYPNHQYNSTAPKTSNQHITEQNLSTEFTKQIKQTMKKRKKKRQIPNSANTLCNQKTPYPDWLASWFCASDTCPPESSSRPQRGGAPELSPSSSSSSPPALGPPLPPQTSPWGPRQGRTPLSIHGRGGLARKASTWALGAQSASLSGCSPCNCTGNRRATGSVSSFGQSDQATKAGGTGVSPFSWA